MVDQLVEARTRYIKLNFKETNTILSNSKEIPTKKIASLVSWLDQSYQQEQQLFERLNLNEGNLEFIFESSLIKILKKNIETEIKAQKTGDLAQCFQMVQLLFLPVLDEACIPAKLTQELRTAGLKKYAEALDTSLIKFKQLIYTSHQDNSLQLER